MPALFLCGIFRHCFSFLPRNKPLTHSRFIPSRAPPTEAGSQTDSRSRLNTSTTNPIPSALCCIDTKRISRIRSKSRGWKDPVVTSSREALRLHESHSLQPIQSHSNQPSQSHGVRAIQSHNRLPRSMSRCIQYVSSWLDVWRWCSER